MKNILQINNLSKSYVNKEGIILALKDINLSIIEGEFLSIVGSSGCGKSSILNILAGLEKSYEGEINYKKDDTKIGYMLQEDALFDWLTVLENALLGLRIQNQLNDNSKNYVIDLLEKYGLKEFIHKYPKSLSGGMRQRVALIRTLAIKPDILLMDEPFSALDYQTRLCVSDDVYNIIKNEKTTVIMVTHDLAEAISMSDRVVVLTKRPGKIKNIYKIDLTGKSTPIENRKAKEFGKYYEMLWKDLDKHV